MWPVSKSPAWVAVCAMRAELEKTTVVPFLMLSVGGWYLKWLMSTPTEPLLAVAAPLVEAGAAWLATRASATAATRTIAFIGPVYGARPGGVQSRWYKGTAAT